VEGGVFAALLSLLVVLVVHDTEGELNKDEADNNKTDDLVR
jgi:hypothetical protein